MLASQGRDGARLVDPDARVELLGKDGLAIMAPQIGIGSVDHADQTLEPRLAEPSPQGIVPALGHIEQEPGDATVVELPLVTVAERRVDALHFHVAIPIGRSRDGAGVRAEAD
jgi:hypothetical protein